MINPAQELSSTADAKNAHLADFLHPKAFNNSLQPNVIFNLPEGNIIRVNAAACKLLGYSKRELLTLNKTDVFNVGESSFKKMISRRKLNGQVKAELLMTKKSGKKFPCEVTSLIFTDKAGARSSIMNIVDLSERQQKQEKINIENDKIVAENIAIAQSKANSVQLSSDDWMESVSRTTYDVIWDWDMSTDEIYFGSNYHKVFGYKLKKNRLSFSEWINSLQLDEKAILKQEFRRAVTTGRQAWQIIYETQNLDQSPRQIVCRARML